MLLEHAAGLGERQLLHIVATETEPIPRLQAVDGGGKRLPQHGEVAWPIGILRLTPVRRGVCGRGLLVGQRREPLLLAQPIHVPL